MIKIRLAQARVYQGVQSVLAEFAPDSNLPTAHQQARANRSSARLNKCIAGLVSGGVVAGQ